MLFVVVRVIGKVVKDCRTVIYKVTFTPEDRLELRFVVAALLVDLFRRLENMRERLYNAVIGYGTRVMTERSRSLDKVCRIRCGITLAHLCMDMEFDTLPGSLVLSSLRLVCRESTGNHELLLTGIRIRLDVALETGKSAFAKHFLKAVSLFRLKESNA